MSVSLLAGRQASLPGTFPETYSRHVPAKPGYAPQMLLSGERLMLLSVRNTRRSSQTCHLLSGEEA